MIQSASFRFAADGINAEILPDPAKASWVADYVDQWTSFPNGKNDDMVDATSQALARMIYSSGDIWEEKDQRCVFDIDRLFNPYGL